MFTKWKIASVAVLGVVSVAKGFVVHRGAPPTRQSIQLQAAADGAGDSNEERRKRLFESKGWPQIKEDMNTVPVFCCANGEGQPLKYQVNEYELAFFYCHVPDAKRELAKAKEETSIPGLDIVPYPLGEVFEMVSENQAIIVPGAEDLSAAGCPAEVSPIGQQIPLFACMDIMQELEDGTAVLPLFFKLEEAKAALSMALKADGGDAKDFEITGLSLERAVEALATVPETPAFQFITPAASIEHIEKYLNE
mmetsp:Transcript_17156/g.31055  ORF Transcript_17156/g.31055 Transcript_17156/m.31055 type:complete len:251 (+) Transcript_17156:40-792(+)